MSTASSLLATPTERNPMIKKWLRGRAVMAAASFLVTGSVVVSLAAPAAATVPNRYYCDPSDNRCYQVNGAHDPNVHNECHWKLSGMAGTPHEITIISCQTWGPIIP